MTTAPDLPRVDEPVFRVEALPLLPYAPHPGLLILTAPHCVLRSIPAYQELTTWRGNTRVLLLRTRRVLADAEHARHVPGVHAVTAIPAGEITVEARFAVVYARYLGQLRHQPPRPSLLAGSPVTCASSIAHATTRPREMTLLPHLTTLSARGVVRDVVVWEWMWWPEAHLRVGPDLPDENLLRSMLPRLLWLRHATRHNQLPRTRAGSLLAQALNGRALSIQDVYRHFRLVRELLGNRTTSSPPHVTRTSREPRNGVDPSSARRLRHHPRSQGSRPTTLGQSTRLPVQA
ncbi:hypothetical protein [Streptoalloteichus hindustanus]|uniref:Uncharacterized protein n=1 Tax=Streptoalloteichus hindustanus TaxID=2017 RepID=A0A1M5HZ13_STRHI|nr:hypothetical protein [Streptoalloteichus hindustanus]SHG21205.1 hypothetical protein SAMN05444320_10721 [Streptoalloteichus hindustanus]